MIPKEIIDDILSRADIKQVAAPYVRLQRAGSIMKGLCPFHSEKTPSFTVYPADNSFYCFGCGAGGTAITFLQKAENLTFVEAADRLATTVGITIPRAEDAYSYKPQFDKKRLLAMNRDAARFFHANLMSNTPEAQEAYQYLHKKRALSDATIKHFGLGYATREYGATYKYLKGLGYTEEEMIAGFLCGKNEETGKIYDAFYNRVMFPIIDAAGNVIAFGGRVMESGVPNKYKNSSDTPVYSKRRNLFALNFAKDAAQEALILCEGYMDVIALHEAGFTNAVATLGTAITPEQARLMKRYTPVVIIAYDMDEAGRRAADKAITLLEEVGLEVRLLKLEGAKDPDEFIKQYGRDRFRAALDASTNKFDYHLHRILAKYTLSVPQEKINAAAEVCKLVASSITAAERDVYAHVAAKALEIDIDVLRKDIERYLRKSVREEKRREISSVKQATLGFSDSVNRDYARMPAVARAEEAVIGILLLYPEQYFPLLKGEEPPIAADDFLTDFNHRVFVDLLASESTSLDQEQYTPEEQGRITRMRVERMQVTDNGRQIFLECCQKLKESAEKQRQKTMQLTAEDLKRMLAQKRAQPKK